MQGPLGASKLGQGIVSQNSVSGVIQEALCILDFLCPKPHASLSACNKHLQQLVHSITLTLTVKDVTGLESVGKGSRPCLALVIVPGYTWQHSVSGWPKCGNLHLLTALNLRQTDAVVAAFAIAVKPKCRQEPSARPQSNCALPDALVPVLRQISVTYNRRRSRQTVSEQDRRSLATAAACLGNQSGSRQSVLICSTSAVVRRALHSSAQSTGPLFGSFCELPRCCRYGYLGPGLMGAAQQLDVSRNQLGGAHVHDCCALSICQQSLPADLWGIYNAWHMFWIVMLFFSMVPGISAAQPGLGACPRAKLTSKACQLTCGASASCATYNLTGGCCSQTVVMEATV
ncbi:hypothetical protein ABBQ32_010798 [Trebouxia sp. C0010 RCD-2024]